MGESFGERVKVNKYLEYHSICPLARIGTPTPSPARECVPPETKGKGGHTRLRVKKVGGPNSDDWRILEHSVYFVG
jgi:hypothetical protein